MMIDRIQKIINELAPYELNYMQVQGLRTIVEGLDYHYNNSIKPESKKSRDAVHEIVAYMGRLGQMYYFLISDFIKVEFHEIPTIKSVIQFRMKYVAHRMVDAPRRGDILMDSGYQFILKPYKPLTDEQRVIPFDLSLCMIGFQVPQINAEEERTDYTFFIEEEHEKIMTEIHECLTRKLEKVKP